MSHTDKPLQEQAFTFHGHTLHVVCRRLPEEVSRVTQTLQLDVEELFANLLDWDIGPPGGGGHGGGGGGGTSSGGQGTQQPAAAAAAAPAPAEGEPAAGASAHLESKKLCGNVASDQPDLIGLDIWPAAVALCQYLARWPALVAGAAVCELGAGAAWLAIKVWPRSLEILQWGRPCILAPCFTALHAGWHTACGPLVVTAQQAAPSLTWSHHPGCILGARPSLPAMH